MYMRLSLQLLHTDCQVMMDEQRQSLLINHMMSKSHSPTLTRQIVKEQEKD